LAHDGSVANAAYRVLSEIGHALDIEQLTDKVLETWNVRRASVKAAIDLDDRFVQVDRTRYWLSRQTEESGEETSSNTFDTVYGNVLLNRQQELRAIRETRQTNDSLEDIRRLGTDLLK
jgi:hypothetical protein